MCLSSRESGRNRAEPESPPTNSMPRDLTRFGSLWASPYGCKRPTFHDEYLPTFNLPHVTLVDTAPLGVSKINEKGVVHDGVEYPLDVLIYATGFQWMATSTFNMVMGRGGRTLSEKWQSEGTKTFLGLHSQGFPNLFIITGPQGGGGSFNFTDAIDTHSDYVVSLLKMMREQG